MLQDLVNVCCPVPFKAKDRVANAAVLFSVRMAQHLISLLLTFVIFGWSIGVMNLADGGLKGKSGPVSK